MDLCGDGDLITSPFVSVTPLLIVVGQFVDAVLQ